MQSVTDSRWFTETRGALKAILTDLPYDSSTDLVLGKLHPYLGKHFPVLYQNVALQDGRTMGKWNISIQALVGSAILASIAYLALTALANLSLIVNGSIGVFKICTSVSLSDEEGGPKTLEQGIHQVLAAVQDWLFETAATPLAIFYGVGTNGIHELYGRLVYIPFTEIKHGATDNEAQMEETRKKFPLISRLADMIQCFFRPEGNQGRLEGFWRFFQGKK